MLHRISHDIDIQTNARAVYAVCRDVNDWPYFMPAVKSARIVEQANKEDLIEISAEVNHEIWTWQSKREFFDSERRIVFCRIEPRPPILSMRGEWTVENAKGEVVCLCLRHFFTLTDESKFAFVDRAIRSNATRDLAAIKQRLEGTRCGGV